MVGFLNILLLAFIFFFLCRRFQNPSSQKKVLVCMDELPESLLLEILSRLDNSADVACCRVAFKAFNTVFPDLGYSLIWSISSSYMASSSLKKVFVDLILKLRIVESVCICLYTAFIDEEFSLEWLPRVSKTLKSLSLFGFPYSNLISAHCHNLTKLNLGFAFLSVDNLNPMPRLTSLTLYSTRLEDQHLDELNKCFPNLQVLNLIRVGGLQLQDPKIHLLNLHTFHLCLYTNLNSLTLITPNLITLKVQCFCPAEVHVEAPMLSHFYLSLFDDLKHYGALTAKKFENLKTLWLDSLYIGSLLSEEFLIAKKVTDLTLGSRSKAPRGAKDSKLTLGKVFTVFPNLTSLCIKSSVWSELEAGLNPEGWEILDGSKGLKTIRAYLKLVDPSLTFSFVSRVLDQCIGLSQVSFFIYGDVDTESKSFMSKCMARWPGLKWRWGIWSKDLENTWITYGMFN